MSADEGDDGAEDPNGGDDDGGDKSVSDAGIAYGWNMRSGVTILRRIGGQGRTTYKYCSIT